MRKGGCPQILLAGRTALAPLRNLARAQGRSGQALEGRVDFEPTAPGLEVHESSAQLATQGHEGPPAGVWDAVAVDQRSPDDLPQKQKTALRRPSPRAPM
jgi:hypothetical protein